MAKKLTSEQKNKAITEQFRIAFENGYSDDNWIRPWKLVGTGLPTNPVTEKDYQGLVNRLLMFMVFGGGYFAGYGQWKSVGAQVQKRTEVGPGLTIYHPIIVKTGNVDSNGKEETMCTGFGTCTVHHFSQVKGWEAPKPEAINPVVRNAAIDKFVKSLGITIVHGGDTASFNQRTKVISMPHVEAFPNTDDYYATLLHEITHWSGHKDNLNRRGGLTRAEEELVAEMGSVMLCVQFNVQQPESIGQDHYQYVASWLQNMKDNDKAIADAGRMAQQALDFINQTAAQAEKEAA